MRELLYSHSLVASGMQPNRWILFMHGLFGKGSDWKKVARGLVNQRPDWGVELVDLRLHGKSLGFSVPHTLEACAEDVRRLMTQKFGTAAQALLGHSLSGKVALTIVQSPPRGLRQVWVVDSGIGPSRIQGEGWRILSALRATPGPFSTHEEALHQLMACGLFEGVAHWVTTNLRRSKGEFYWPWAVEDLASLREDYVQKDLWHLIEERRRCGPQIHVLRADKSHIMSRSSVARIRAAAAPRDHHVYYHHLSGGHAIHVKNTAGVVRLLAAALPQSKA